MNMRDKPLVKEVRTAIKLGDIRKVVELTGSDESLLLAMTPFGTWLHVASSHGQLEIVKRLVEMGLDVNACGGIFGGTPLNEAASEGHIEIVKYLLSHGGKMDVSEPEKNPLFSSIYGGHLAIAKLLVENGIDTNVKYSGTSMNNMDALSFAQERGQSDIANILASASKGN
jgi:ankyrin repeat protein